MSNVVVTPEFLNLESPRLARAILEHVIAHADIVGEDPAGRPIIRFEFVCPPWLMDKLAAYGCCGRGHGAGASIDDQHTVLLCCLVVIDGPYQSEILGIETTLLTR